MDPDGSFNDWDLLILVEEAIQWCVTIRCCMPWVLGLFFLEIQDAKARQDCINEIDLLRQCNHKNVIEYLASFIENNEVGGL